MKSYYFMFIIIIILSLTAGCNNGGPKNVKTEIQDQNNKSTGVDTGYTGVEKYYGTDHMLKKEVTLKNGIRNGLMKTFYPGGQMYQTFWYENGLRTDTSCWYYEDGKVFRKTPYLKDSINGTQIQYYKNGKVRAKLGYINGLRTPYLEEFLNTGKKITIYPDMVIITKDEYNQNGTYKIYLELTDKEAKVTYYKGEFIEGLFVPKKYTVIKQTNGKGYLELKKTGAPNAGYVGLIAEINSSLGNKYLLYKRLIFPI